MDLLADAPLADPLLLRVVRSDADRAAAVALLLLSGVSEPHVRAWAADGEIFVLCDSASCAGECPLAAALLMPLGTGRTTELRLLSIDPELRGQGLGRRLLYDLYDVLRARGVRRLVSSTSNADMSRIALFQKSGFRFSHIERDGCTPELGWQTGKRADGMADRDLLWFEIEL